MDRFIVFVKNFLQDLFFFQIASGLPKIYELLKLSTIGAPLAITPVK
jgi:hypothetical protein